MISLRTLAAVCILSAVPMIANAQTAPDAGSLQRETTRIFVPPPTAPKPARPAPMKEKDKGERVKVTSFYFVMEDGALLPGADFMNILTGLIGKSLTFHELEQAIQSFDAYYRAKGFFARAYLPAQEIKDGTVRVVIVQGRLGAVTVEKKGKRADADFAKEIVSRGLKLGEPLSYPALERGLLLANDLPGMQTSGILKPGQRSGETNLMLNVEDQPLIDTELMVNNQGPRATGEVQGAGSLNINPGNGGQFSVHALGNQDLQFTSGAYTHPLGADGWRLSLNGSYLHYRLGKEFEALNAHGYADTFGVGIRYPIIRSERTNVFFSGNAEYRYYKDESLDASTKRKELEAANLGLSWDRSDISGRGWTQASLSFVGGNLNLTGEDLAADQAGPHAAGAYFKLGGQVNRLQRLGMGFSLSARVNGQWADKHLDSSEKFALGGPYGVRAYPVNEASGDSGLVATLELNKELGAGFSAAIFFDHGDIWVGRESSAGSALPNQYALYGAGLGLAYHYAGNWFVQFTVAQPVGNNPGVSDSSREQDGSRHGTRFWVTGVIRF